MTTRTLAGVFVKLLGLHVAAWTVQMLGSMLGILLPLFSCPLDVSSRSV
jgi:hypothetical protein